MPHVPHNQGLCPPNCFGCKAASVGFSSTAMITRKPAISERVKSEAVIERDVPAYRRLRAEGLQPHTVNHAAEVEQRAGSRWEVETGQDLGGNARLGELMQETNDAYLAGELTAS